MPDVTPVAVAVVSATGVGKRSLKRLFKAFIHRGRHLNIPAQAPLNLLHTAAVGTLATHARQPEGFPYPSVLPFAPDHAHRPTILVSRLAEHTHNLHADPRAGFLVVDAPDGDVLNGQRATLLGRFEPVDPAPGLIARYLRYHPDAERYLVLGDFTFWAMKLDRLRYIGGFGAMGWLGGDELDALAPLEQHDEDALIGEFADALLSATGYQLIGVDRYGLDLRQSGLRKRFAFESGKPDIETLHVALEDCIRRQGG